MLIAGCCENKISNTGLRFNTGAPVKDTLVLGAPNFIKIPVDNITADTVQITDSRVSCSCSEISFSAQTINPASSIVITLRIIPDSNTLNKSSSITAAIKTNQAPQINTMEYQYFTKNK
jgi:Protein of unknown function (DUF1573)